MKNRVIPCLLLRNKGLVKSVKFENPTYVGDPINAVKIFNEKEVDELIFLDITASKEKKRPNYDLISDIASECFMPFCYGGGVRTIEDVKRILFLGAEKVAINSYAIERPEFIKEISAIFGSQSIVVAIDVKKKLMGGFKVFDSSKGETTSLDPIDYAVEMTKNGAGEIFLNSVDRDGTFSGYNLDLISRMSKAINVPLVVCGGAGGIENLSEAIKAGASAVAAGSIFVFFGKHRAVLINYPSQDELKLISG